MWKKQTAANLFICVVIESSLSSITPRLRTWDDGWINAPAINRGVMGQSWRRRGDPSQISSVFAGLRRRRFGAIQFLTSSTQEDRRSTSDEVWAVSAWEWEYIWRSSAYEWALCTWTWLELEPATLTRGFVTWTWLVLWNTGLDTSLVCYVAVVKRFHRLCYCTKKSLHDIT